MSFEVIKTTFPEIILIKNHIFTDNRGIYCKNYELDEYKENGINFDITESSDLYTKKGSIRGLHFQVEEPQKKLVRVVKGKVYDVVVDIRENSDTYLKTFEIELSEKDGVSIYIPGGFAHGFLALEDTIFSYHCSGKYKPNFCKGIRWNDPKLNIQWPLKENDINDVIVTEKDREWKLL